MGYLWRPCWDICSVPDEIRVARVDDGEGQGVMARMNMQLELQREYLFEAEQAPNKESPLAPPPSARQAPQPRQGSVSPR